MSYLTHSDVTSFVRRFVNGAAAGDSPERIAADLGLSMGQFNYRLRKINFELASYGKGLPALKNANNFPNYHKIANSIPELSKPLHVEDDEFFTLDE